MDDPINLTSALESEIAVLKNAMKRPINIGDSYPGRTQIERMKSIIADLEALLRTSEQREPK